MSSRVRELGTSPSGKWVLTTASQGGMLRVYAAPFEVKNGAAYRLHRYHIETRADAKRVDFEKKCSPLTDDDWDWFVVNVLLLTETEN